MHHRVRPSKTWWPSSNVVIFPPVLRLVHEDPKQWPPLRLLIHELILEDRRISAKLIEATGHLTWAAWVHHSWRFGHAEAVCEVGPEMPERGTKTSTVPVVWANSGIFSARSKWFPVANGDHGRNLVISLWPGVKATINGVAAQRLIPPPKFQVQKSAGKFSPRFNGIKTASSSLIIFQMAKLST